jgi:hypothetical protein
MKKISTEQTLRNEIFKEQKLTIGMDLGDRWSARFPPSISSRPCRSNPQKQSSPFPMTAMRKLFQYPTAPLLAACRPFGS